MAGRVGPAGSSDREHYERANREIAQRLAAALPAQQRELLLALLVELVAADQVMAHLYVAEVCTGLALVRERGSEEGASYGE